MQKVTFFEQFRNKDELAQYVKKNVGGSVGDFIKENLPLEKEFQKDIFEALRSWKAKGLINRNSLIWKEGSGVYQRAGLPDVCAIIDGHYFGFEVKRPFIGTVSGIQKKTIETINAAGGTARVVCYASEVQKIIQDTGYVTDHFAVILRQNNLKKIRFHDLRHSCASLLLANKIPMKMIQDWLGHSDMGTTANIYSHIDFSSKIASAEVIGNVLTG